jgi:hypothetical protein
MITRATTGISWRVLGLWVFWRVVRVFLWVLGDLLGWGVFGAGLGVWWGFNCFLGFRFHVGFGCYECFGPCGFFGFCFVGWLGCSCVFRSALRFLIKLFLLIKTGISWPFVIIFALLKMLQLAASKGIELEREILEAEYSIISDKVVQLQDKVRFSSFWYISIK